MPEETNHSNQTMVKSKTVKTLRRRDTFFSQPSNEKKEAIQENICYYLPQRDKAKILAFCELDKVLRDSRCYVSIKYYIRINYKM